MPALLPDVDPDGLLEFSVVYTDRALNHMSQKFQGVMRDISAMLKEVYHARSAVVVPGSGTYGMEAVARQFATGQKVLVIRNGWFSYRWTQIFDMGGIPSQSIVLKARRVADEHQAAFVPAPIDEVVATIRAERPAVVFAPHVETAAGMILPDDYLKAVADAVHEVVDRFFQALAQSLVVDALGHGGGVDEADVVFGKAHRRQRLQLHAIGLRVLPHG